jgi:hypothetical protein
MDKVEKRILAVCAVLAMILLASAAFAGVALEDRDPAKMADGPDPVGFTTAFICEPGLGCYYAQWSDGANVAWVTETYPGSRPDGGEWLICEGTIRNCLHANVDSLRMMVSLPYNACDDASDCADFAEDVCGEDDVDYVNFTDDGCAFGCNDQSSYSARSCVST